MAGHDVLDRLEIPDPWRRNVDVSLELIDDLELQIATLTVQLRRMSADHRYIPLLVAASGFGWINASTVAPEIGDIERFASPVKLCGYTGPCPKVMQSGNTDRRGPLSNPGPRYRCAVTCAGTTRRSTSMPPPGTRGPESRTPPKARGPAADRCLSAAVENAGTHARAIDGGALMRLEQ